MSGTTNLLAGVKDVLGKMTIYQYDNKVGMIKSTDPVGWHSTITYSCPYGYVKSVLDENGKGYTFDFDYNESTQESYAMFSSPSGQVKEVWYDKYFKTKKVRQDGVRS